MREGPGTPVEILLVEDSPGDGRLVMEALKDAPVANNLHWLEDGEEAMRFLRREAGYAAAARPDLILLDLNLPKKNGLRVLEEVKSDPHLKRIPVVIMTTSKAEEDILGAYGLHANAYVSKPIDLNKFLEAMRSIEDFWLVVATLPPKGKR